MQRDAQTRLQHVPIMSHQNSEHHEHHLRHVPAQTQTSKHHEHQLPHVPLWRNVRQQMLWYRLVLELAPVDAHDARCFGFMIERVAADAHDACSFRFELECAAADAHDARLPSQRAS